ncbi:MAG: V-type ATP synthase subunit E [Candidatus Thorarchaeota archaeon]
MSGVDNIIDIINSKTKEECAKIIAEAEEYKAQRLENAKKRAKTITDEIAGKAEREADAEIAKYQASALLQAKYKLLESKEAIMTEVYDTALEKIQKSVLDDKYDQTVFRLVIDGAASLQEPEIEIVLPEGQKVKLDSTALATAIAKEAGTKSKVNVSNDTVRATGGVIVRSKDGSKWVDNTFEARKERLDASLRDRVANLLFSEKSSN